MHPYGSPSWREAMAAATELAGQLATDPLAAASAIRRAGIEPALASAALTQVGLRARAKVKFGSDAEAMFFTRTGLEQATRAAVATRRATRLAASGARSVADLCCGIGADTIAFARAGLRVTAVEADPETAAVTSANVSALGLDDLVTVLVADATTVDLAGIDAVFCDPARRTAGGRRIFDPRAYSPPWAFVMALAQRIPRTVLKVAPGIDHAMVPAGIEAEWVSVDGEVVEAALWCGPLAEVPRRATLLGRAVERADRCDAAERSGPAVAQLTGTGERTARVAAPGRYLHDPDGAVVRAHLVAELCELLGGWIADESIAYIYTDRPGRSGYGQAYRVLETLPIALKRMRTALRAMDVGTLTILKRGSALDVERLRRELRLSGRRTAALVLTRIAGAPAALLCERI